MLARFREKLLRKQRILIGRIRRAKSNKHLNGKQSDVMETLHDRSEEKIDEIQYAFLRMEEGSYGYCEDCGQTIRLERLEALPTASTCIECQKKNEGD